MTRFSSFGNKLGGTSGITSLMEDLGNALNSGSDIIMMGGGNPAHIPEVEKVFKEKLSLLTEDRHSMKRLIGIYDPPQVRSTLSMLWSVCLIRNMGGISPSGMWLLPTVARPVFSCCLICLRANMPQAYQSRSYYRSRQSILATVIRG